MDRKTSYLKLVLNLGRLIDVNSALLVRNSTNLQVLGGKLQ